MTRTHTNNRELESDGDTPSEQAKHSCSECGGDVIHDQTQGELCCQDCGLIEEEAVIDRGPEWRSFDSDSDNKSRVGAPSTNLMHDKGLSTIIGRRNRDAYGRMLNTAQRKRMSRLRRWDERVRTKNSKERNLKHALGEISRMGAALGLPKHVEETAGAIYRRCLADDLLIGRSIEGMSTASLYAASRQEGVPRSLDEFEIVSRVERIEISRAYRYIAAELGLSVQPTNPKEYLPRFACDLDVPESVHAQARELLNIGQEQQLFSGRNPVGLAAAAIYASAKLHDIKMTQYDVSDVSGMSTVTIRNRYQELLEAAAESDSFNL